MKKHLQMFDLAQSYFDRIVELMETKIDIISSNDDIAAAQYGYSPKTRIKYWRGDNADYIVIQNMYLVYLLEDEFGLPANEKLNSEPSWKQFIIRSVADDKCGTCDKAVSKAVTGAQAWKWLETMTGKYYSDDDFDVQMAEHQADYDNDLKQIHELVDLPQGTVWRIPNCVYYDINGAHQDALREIFPLCGDEIKALHEKRHDDPSIKPKFNYAVGMMVKKGYRKTYNWIVQRTTHKLRALMDQCGGKDTITVYANTDGVILADPQNRIAASAQLGQFKLEHEGDIYLYRGKNYWCIQYGSTIKGNLPLALRENVDLREGKVVSFTKAVNTLNNGIRQYRYEDVGYRTTEVVSTGDL